MKEHVWVFYRHDSNGSEIRLLYKAFMVQISSKRGVEFNDYGPFNQQIALKCHRNPDRIWKEVSCSW